MSKVTFDYSKAAPFLKDHEMELMKKLALDAKDVLVAKTGAGNDFLGWITMIKKSLTESRKQRQKSRAIPMYCW